MGGGDSLYDKIDKGVRGAKIVLTCVTTKYAMSANCRREVSLVDSLKKPIVPLLLEKMTWPPSGPMSMVFTQLLYINFGKDESVQERWDGEKFEELLVSMNQHVPGILALGNEKESEPAVEILTPTEKAKETRKPEPVKHPSQIPPQVQQQATPQPQPQAQTNQKQQLQQPQQQQEQPVHVPSQQQYKQEQQHYQQQQQQQQQQSQQHQQQHHAQPQYQARQPAPQQSSSCVLL